MNSHLTFFLHKHDTQIHPRHRLIITRVNSMNCLIKVHSPRINYNPFSNIIFKHLALHGDIHYVYEQHIPTRVFW